MPWRPVSTVSFEPSLDSRCSLSTSITRPSGLSASSIETASRHEGTLGRLEDGVQAVGVGLIGRENARKLVGLSSKMSRKSSPSFRGASAATWPGPGISSA